MIWIVDEPTPRPEKTELAARVRAQLALYSCSTARLRRVELVLFGRCLRRRVLKAAG